MRALKWKLFSHFLLLPALHFGPFLAFNLLFLFSFPFHPPSHFFFFPWTMRSRIISLNPPAWSCLPVPGLCLRLVALTGPDPDSPLRADTPAWPQDIPVPMGVSDAEGWGCPQGATGFCSLGNQDKDMSKTSQCPQSKQKLKQKGLVYSCTQLTSPTIHEVFGFACKLHRLWFYCFHLGFIRWSASESQVFI